MTAQSEERVDVVDENDRVLRQVTRSQMRREVLLHRVVAILCMNSRQQIFIHRRTPSKDLFPNMYDMFVAGTVVSGEDYVSTAQRELAEELGINGKGKGKGKGVELERLFHHRYEGPETRAHTEVYRVVWDGPISLQADEIAWGEFRSRADLVANRDGLAFVPDGAELFARYSTLY
jgi:isopentenyldiphosphate isomerase